jgi:hypothetical protein
MTLADRMEHLATADLQRSLTPHADLAEAAIAAMMANLAPRLALPGRRGARARLQAAMNAAFHRALGREYDADLSRQDLIPMAAETLGHLLAALVLELAHDKPLAARMEIAFEIVGFASSAALGIVGNSDDLADGDFSAVIGKITRPGRT